MSGGARSNMRWTEITRLCEVCHTRPAKGDPVRGRKVCPKCRVRTS